jgi:hypothetical protein
MFGLFEDSATLDTNRRLKKLFWTHSMELVCDVGRVESRFSPFRDNVSVSAR